ncbi:MAG: hypothetical protein ABIR31_07325, partial [Ginsengibacter sp.]
MVQRILFYVYIVCTIIFFSCQKEAVYEGNDYKILGSSAHDLLSSSKYWSLKIEIDYMPGYALDTSSLNNLVTFLSLILNKPGGIHISQEPI